MKNALRWIAVLPAAIGAYFAAVVVQSMLLLILSSYSDFGLSWLAKTFPEVSDIIFRSVGVYFFVIAGAAVAPQSKYPTALALSILVWVFSIVVLVVILLFRIQTQVFSLVEIPFLCSAAAIAFIQEYKKEKHRQTEKAIEYEGLHNKAINSKLVMEDDTSRQSQEPTPNRDKFKKDLEENWGQGIGAKEIADTMEFADQRSMDWARKTGNPVDQWFLEIYRADRMAVKYRLAPIDWRTLPEDAKCFYHQGRDAVNFCPKCGKPICSECVYLPGSMPICCNCWDQEFLT